MEKSVIKTSRAHVASCSHYRIPLMHGARVWLRAASFADRKEKNDSGASENGRLANNIIDEF